MAECSPPRSFNRVTGGTCSAFELLGLDRFGVDVDGDEGEALSLRLDVDATGTASSVESCSFVVGVDDSESAVESWVFEEPGAGNEAFRLMERR
jgi:hypothetical protein